ncbi:MAG: response regulator [Defluviitaleaceae bacterium]|nr:response regulator [Defluviitaleaceae bacterium]
MNVIIVDDERNAGENLQTKIEQIPAIKETTVFNNPRTALNFAEHNAIDIAFLDIEMPEISGIEMARQLKGINPKINVVFVTAYNNYAVDAFKVSASDYLIKPATIECINDALAQLRYPVSPPIPHIRIQTFGHFEVFVDGEALHITRSKAKELLAYLVDKRGTSVGAAHIAAILWEDKAYDRSLQKQTQTVITHLIKILKEAGIDDIIVRGWNSLSLDVTKFDCDYYRFLEGDTAAINAFTGEYMDEYSWAEETAAYLTFYPPPP